MPQITVVNQSGEETQLNAPEGRTLMEVIRDNGFDELLAPPATSTSIPPTWTSFRR